MSYSETPIEFEKYEKNKLNKIIASMQNTNNKVNPQGTVKLNVRHDNKSVLNHISIL